MPVRLSIVEDVRGTRETLVALLAREPGLQCVSSYALGEDALAGLPHDAPDVVLMDINLPGLNGIACVARLKELLPRTQFLMLTTYEDSDLIFESLRAGASGYLLKSLASVELVQAIEQAHAGGAPMSMQIARKVVDYFRRLPPAPPEMQHLTPRENEILALLAKGFLYKEIADHLGIALSTVRAHLHTIYEKLHVQSRTEAVVKFLRR